MESRMAFLVGSLAIFLYGLMIFTVGLMVSTSCLAEQAMVRGKPITARWSKADTSALEEGVSLDLYRLSWACDTSGSGYLTTRELSAVLPESLLGHCQVKISARDTLGLYNEASLPTLIFIPLNAPTGLETLWQN